MMLLLFVIVCFFVSGASGLVYENVWMKELGLVLGNTALATTLVLTAFMGGLALGSWAIASRADRLERPLKVYGWLEVGIAVAAMAFPVLLDLVKRFHLEVFAPAGMPPHLLTASRFVALLALLLVPTALMGATLPVLCAFSVARAGRAGRTLGVLYAVNSLGAVAGSLLTGFLLVRTLGLWASSFVGQLANIGVGFAALIVDRFWLDEPPPDAAPAADAEAPAPQPDVVYAAVLVSGFAAMLYEVALMRMLPLILGSSVYSFALMVSAFITGIAIGSSAAGALVPRMRRPLVVLGALQLAVGVLFMAIVPTFNYLPLVYGVLRSSIGGSFGTFQVVSLGLCFALMMGPTLALGAVLPVAAEAVGRQGRVGAAIGRLYGMNTVGNILGTLSTGLVLVPWLGFKASMEVGVLMNVAAGVALIVRSGARGAVPTGSLATAALAASAYLMFYPAVDPLLLSAGTFRGSTSVDTWTLASLRGGRKLLLFREDSSSFVTLERRPDGRLALRVNGKVDASNGADMATQKLLAHLPLLAHRNPKRVYVLGLGSGVTAGSALAHPGVEALTCVELSPGVVDAAAFFAKENGDVLKNPKLELAIDDGRIHLERTRERFDVIISEPSNPWIAGISSLFSLEYFGIMRAHLEPGGIACQWLHTYELDSETFRLVLRTYMKVFPHVMLFTSHRADVIMLGSMDPIRFDAPSIEPRMASPAVRDDLASVGVTSPLHLLLQYLAHGPSLERFAGIGEVNTDDWPLLEYRAPLGFFAGRSVALPGWELRVHGPDSPVAKHLRGKPPTAAQLLELAPYVIEEFGPNAAVTFLREVVAEQPTNVKALKMLAEQLFKAGDRRTALEHIEEAARFAPDDLGVQKLRYEIGYAVDGADISLRHPRRYPISTDAARACVRLEPDDEKMLANLGAVLFSSERWAEAEQAYRRAAERAPRDPVRWRYYQLVISRSLLRLGNLEAAMRHFGEAGIPWRDLPPAQREFGRELSAELEHAHRTGRTGAWR